MRVDGEASRTFSKKPVDCAHVETEVGTVEAGSNVRKGGDNKNDAASVDSPGQRPLASGRGDSATDTAASNRSEQVTKTQPSGPAAAPISEAIGSTPETTPLEAMGRGRSGDRQIKKQKLPAGSSKVGRKLSPERMRLSSRASGNVPSYPRQPAKQAFTAKHLSIG